MEEQERDPREEVAKIFTSAGWTAGDKFEWETGAFHAPNLLAVGGIDPSGMPRSRAVRTDLITDALWLVEHARQQANPLTTEATLDPLALQSEEVENPATTSLVGEVETPVNEPVHGGDDVADQTAPADSDLGVVHDQVETLAPDENPAEPEVLEQSEILEPSELSELDGSFTDADFTEGEDLGSELLDVELESEIPALIEAVNIQSAEYRELTAAEHDAILSEGAKPDAPQDRFIGLDDLDRVRSLRIGDVATEALRLTTMIEEAVSEQEGEFSNIQAYVVSHLDKHTGAFTPQDEASIATYGRFLELSSARSKIALIDARRKDATAFLIAAGRDDVVNFDVKAAFA